MTDFTKVSLYKIAPEIETLQQTNNTLNPQVNVNNNVEKSVKLML